MKPELELARYLAEALKLLLELEGYLADPDPTEHERICAEVVPRLAQLRRLMMN